MNKFLVIFLIAITGCTGDKIPVQPNDNAGEIVTGTLESVTYVFYRYWDPKLRADYREQYTGFWIMGQRDLDNRQLNPGDTSYRGETRLIKMPKDLPVTWKIDKPYQLDSKIIYKLYFTESNVPDKYLYGEYVEFSVPSLLNVRDNYGSDTLITLSLDGGGKVMLEFKWHRK